MQGMPASLATRDSINSDGGHVVFLYFHVKKEPMQKQMSPLLIVWAQTILPALLYILPLLMFQYHCLFKIRLAEG